MSDEIISHGIISRSIDAIQEIVLVPLKWRSVIVVWIQGHLRHQFSTEFCVLAHSVHSGAAVPISMQGR